MEGTQFIEKICHESIFQIIVPNMGEEEILHVLADKNTIYRFENGPFFSLS